MKENIKELILETVFRNETISQSDLVLSICKNLTQLDSEKEKVRKVKPEYIIARTIKSLFVQELLTKTDMSTLRLSRTGYARMAKRNEYKDVIPMPLQGARNGIWDGMWRIVILNFNEEERQKRDIVRNILKEAGFKSIKQSVWASPFVCEPLIAEVKRKLDLKFEIIMLTTRHIDPAIDLLLD